MSTIDKSSILHEAFVDILKDKISPSLFQNQSSDQHAFTSEIRIENIFRFAELVIEYAIEIQEIPWVMNMDLPKLGNEHFRLR